MLTPQLMEQIAQRISGQQQDPLIGAMLSSMMQNGRETEAGAEAGPDAGSEAELARWKAKVRRLRADLEAANEMLRAISNIFGACELCWGENQECPRCHGHGRPGSSVPIHDDLLRWVKPALSRIGYRVIRTAA